MTRPTRHLEVGERLPSRDETVITVHLLAHLRAVERAHDDYLEAMGRMRGWDARIRAGGPGSGPSDEWREGWLACLHLWSAEVALTAKRRR
jgi:hypothetical protein